MAITLIFRSVLVGGEEILSLCLGVSRRRRFHKISDAVEKRVQESTGNIVLGCAPLVETFKIGDGIIDVRIQIQRRNAGRRCHRRHRCGQAKLPALRLTWGQHPQQNASQQQAEYRRNDLGVYKELVMSAARHRLGFPEVEHVLKIQRVVPELQLEVVAQAESETNPAAAEKRGPCFAGKSIEKQRKQNDRYRIERHNLPMGEITQQRAFGVRSYRQHQQSQPHAEPGAGQQDRWIEMVYRPLPLGPGRVRLTAQEKDFA